jgi:D-glycero-alpha-D-manno-heptose 1-phosphate guanylyltransferase
MQALILAGGKGTRLKAAVPDLPKPMAPIGARPFLAFLLDALERAGFRAVVLSVGYKYRAIMNYFGNRHGGIDIDYAIESSPLGTGGGVVNALGRIVEDPFFVINGDTFLRLDHGAMWRKHAAAHAAMTIAVTHVPDVSRYGRVLIREERIAGFQEKGGQGAGYINAGTYLLQKDVFDRFDLPRVFSFEEDFLRPNVGVLRPAAFVSDGYFIDIGIPEEYRRAQLELPQQR